MLTRFLLLLHFRLRLHLLLTELPHPLQEAEQPAADGGVQLLLLLLLIDVDA
jgi:hypothetical protein